MPPSSDNLDRFLHAISDPSRRLILRALLERGANSLGEQRVKLSQPTVSHHMKILEKAQLVTAVREGHWRWYRRNEKLIREMTKNLKTHL